MSTIGRQFTLSVVCLIVECTKDSIRVTKKHIQIVVGRLGWKWIERSVLQLLLLKQKEVELLLDVEGKLLDKILTNRLTRQLELK